MTRRARRFALALTVAGVALGSIAAAPAGAKTLRSEYNLTGPWFSSVEYGGLCLKPLNCPAVTNVTTPTLHTHLEGLTGVGSSVAASFTTAPFTYNGAGGRQPQDVALRLKRLASEATKVNVTTEAFFSVAILNATGDHVVVQPFPHEALTPTDRFTKVGPAAIRRNVLRKGRSYRLRITSNYVDGAQVLKSADAYYDKVRLIAKRHLRHR
jgi:hypothetical protein